MKHARILLIASAIVVTGCAQPPEPVPLGPGFSGTNGSLGAPGAALGAGTLPGTQISDTILFTVDQSTLGADAIATLDQQVNWLTQNASLPVLIEGHADERGTGEYNLALGASRASAVRNYMVSQGVPDTRISIITYGRERPVATCADESCWSQNRRAVTVVTGVVGS
ncbi:MAG: peptidoglycan-associated lipoprotein Pal [Pseudomonadota bacterium]